MIPLRSFSVLRDKKILTENCNTPSLTPLLIQKIHRNLNFCEEQKAALRKFSALWDNIISVKNRDIPVIGIKFSDTRDFLKHRRVLYEMNR